MANGRRKATDKQAAELIAAYQRGEQLPAGTIFDFTEAPYVFHATGTESPTAATPAPADAGKSKGG